MSGSWSQLIRLSSSFHVHDQSTFEPRPCTAIMLSRLDLYSVRNDRNTYSTSASPLVSSIGPEYNNSRGCRARFYDGISILLVSLSSPQTCFLSGGDSSTEGSCTTSDGCDVGECSFFADSHRYTTATTPARRRISPDRTRSIATTTIHVDRKRPAPTEGALRGLARDACRIGGYHVKAAYYLLNGEHAVD